MFSLCQFTGRVGGKEFPAHWSVVSGPISIPGGGEGVLMLTGLWSQVLSQGKGRGNLCPGPGQGGGTPVRS